MAFNQAMLVSSSLPSGLASSLVFKDGTKARLSMHSIQRKRVEKGVKSLEDHGRRYYSEWRCRCNSQKVSAIFDDLNHIEESSTHQEGHEISRVLADHPDGLQTTAIKKLDAFHRFIRPYAVSGIAASSVSMGFLAVESMSDLSPVFFLGLLKTVLPAAFISIYGMGVNQVFDVEIDKINKPSLPLASGELSIEEGILITTASCAMSIFMGLKSGSPPLLFAILALFFLTSAYSVNLPLLRWKENPVLTSFFTIVSLGIIHNIPFFIHMQKYVLGRPVVITKSIVFATAFTSLFSGVISVFKDIPDLEGDKRAGIQNFIVRLGAEKAFWLSINTLLAGYGIAMLVGATSTNTYLGLITVLGHGIFASILWLRARSVDIQNTTSMQSFYMFIWQLLTVEYLILPFMR